MPPLPAAGTVGQVSGLRSLHARLKAMDRFRADLLLAGFFVAAGATEMLVLHAKGGDRPLTVAAAVISLSGLAFRRRDPLLASVIFTVPAVVQAPIGGFYTAESTVPFLGMLLLLYSIGRYAPGRRFYAAFPITVAGILGALATETGWKGADDLFWASFLFTLPALAGRAMLSRTELHAQLREKAERAEVERRVKAEAAVERERARIASELQALVANGVSAMVVQAETVPRAIAAGETGQARVALAAVEDTGRDALTEMRRLLGVLRRDGDGPELVPQPGLGRLAALIERVRAAGLEVSLSEEGDARPLPTGIDLTAYRIVEDALDAALEGGASRAEVLVRYDDRDLVLGVRDDRKGGASHRLPGLRDRASIYGGSLRAGRRDGGMFALRARLPLEAGEPVGTGA
jgi:signal transduction histidine kinase